MPEAVHDEKLEGTSVTKREVEGEVEVEATTNIDHGDYAARLEEILGQGDEEEEEEEEFLYQGEDSQEAPGTYNEQLQDVLRELDNDAPGIDLQEEREVESHLEGNDAYIDDEAPGMEVQSNYMTSIPASPSGSPLGATPTTINVSPRIHLTKAFLHPSISRLRSFNPHSQPASPSPDTTLDAYQSPSHFSAMSRTPSISNGQLTPEISRDLREEREAFRWTVLRDIGRWLYMETAASTLGSFHGSPTVLAANGLICVGTDRGRVLVFNFKQLLMCVCGTDDISELAGPVSALSLSHDHTYIAVGYAHGHINLFELSRPQAPVRTVLPTSLPAVLSGRKEGHLEGTRILSLAFVGARHTAIVSADESGLAFYHSLGKVLFIEASDTIRILGKYPETTEDTLPPKGANGAKSSSSHTNEGGAIHSAPRSRPWRRPKGNTILAMASLPLGAAAHPTEAYGLTALLTPAKLVIVGLTPSPRTWFRCHRDSGVSSGASKWRGCLAWFPSVDPAVELHNTEAVGHHSNGKQTKNPKNPATRPVLAYTWDRFLHLLRVSETKVRRTVHSTKNPGKSVSVEVNKIVVEEVAVCSSDSDILAIQWLNIHQLLTLTLSHLEVWDVRTLRRVEHTPFRANTLLPCTDSGEVPEGGLIAHSMRVYKGKIFLIGLNEMKVGTLLSWADRILAFVEEGDFLSAIETARSYLLGTAPGSRIGLPDDPSALRSLVGNRMHDLMTASARYAFADERMTDDTHVTPDGRGVDRTQLFEGLVTVCTKACIALNDFDFLFETLFEEYDNACIAHIFLERLEPFVLDGTLRTIPPRISQRLIGRHEDHGDLENAERLIWHIDPECLDINQAVTLCQKNKLYDALLYVYTCSLHDFVAPLVELLGLVRRIRKIQHDHRASHLEALDNASTFSMTSLQSVENMVSDGYKIYAYLEDILSGLSYPSQAPMPSDESSRAKRDVYHFLFKGLSYTHMGLDGKAILLSAEEGEVEQTYPYVRLLLQFDAEAFLHVMDIAFEDGYFNEDPPGVDRLVITRILMEILSTPGISSSEATMLNIFIARNVPKYPQSIYMYMAPSTLHSILVSLAEDSDLDTREDRQLAAEYLLSVYTPHNSEKMIRVFDDAKFFRILRSWYRQENKLGPLISAYLRDPDIGTADKFHSIDDILSNVSYPRNRAPPEEVLEAILDSVPRLLDSSIMDTAILMDKHAPNLHSQVLETLDNDKQKYAYLRCLLEPSASPEEYHMMQPVLQQRSPSRDLDPSFQELYLNLLCNFNTDGILSWLNGLKEGHLDWDTVVSVCERNGVYDAVIWTLDKQGDVKNAFQRLENVSEYLASELGDLFASESEYGKDGYDLLHLTGKLTVVGNMGLRICQHYSTAGVDVGGLTAEDMWFRLLSSQIDAVQTVSGYYSMGAGHEELKGSQEHQTLESLRLLVQTTFASLLALGSSPVLSFPRLFRRLVESTSGSRSSSRSSYSEFRTILTGMLDSYRNEGDLLLITNHLVRRDLFTVVEELSKCSSRGSRVRGTLCAVCKELLPVKRSTAVDPSPIAKVDEWIIQRSTGLPYHRRCLPSIDPS